MLQDYPEGADIEYQAGPDARWTAIQIGRDRLQRAALRCLGRELTLPARHTHNAPVDREALTRLTGTTELAMREPSAPGGRAERWGEMVAAAGAAAIAGIDAERAARPDARSLRWWGVMRRADAFLGRQEDERYDSARLCRHLGLSERNLQLHVQAASGVSPKACHLCLALHAARSRLRQEAVRGRTVTENGLDCGFPYLGRFSGAYRALFGESPSRTRG